MYIPLTIASIHIQKRCIQNSFFYFKFNGGTWYIVVEKLKRGTRRNDKTRVSIHTHKKNEIKKYHEPHKNAKSIQQ